MPETPEMDEKCPQGFVDLLRVIPELHCDLRYAGPDNFTGAPVTGYTDPRPWLSEPAAQALAPVQEALLAMDLSLLILDAYRPARAVRHFLCWAGDGVEDAQLRQRFHPTLAKAELFTAGYLAPRSSHSRGSTVDLTLCAQGAGEDTLPMGTEFDFFGPASWPQALRIGLQERANRLLLQQLMLAHGFVQSPLEWWHFTLRNEPYPERYFDFPLGAEPAQPPSA
ncbi:MAG: M15 family metallopeptidase [Acidithiobacillus sp.]